MCHNLQHKVQTPAKTLVLLAAVGSWIPAQSILVMAGTCRILVAAFDLVVTNASQFVPLPQVSSPATVTDVSFGMWSSSQLSSNRQPFVVPGRSFRAIVNHSLFPSIPEADDILLQNVFSLCLSGMSPCFPEISPPRIYGNVQTGTKICMHK